MGMKPLRTLLGYTRDMRGLFIIIGITSVVGALMSFVAPVIIKYATDWITGIVAGNDSFDWMTVFTLSGALILAALVQMIFNDIGGYFGDQMSVRTRYQLSTRYYEHLLKLPQSYYDDEVTGKIINRLSRAIGDVSGFLQFFANNLLQMLLMIVITIGVLAFYSWPIALLFFLLMPANLYLTARTSKPWQELEAQKNTHFDIASGRFAEVIGQMRLVKSFGAQRRELDGFGTEMRKMLPLTATQSKRWHTMNALRSTAFGVINGAILGFLFYETASGNFTIGDMVMILTLIQQASFPLRNLSFFVDNYQRAIANSRDYIAALSVPIEPEAKGTKALTVTDGRVEFDTVDFTYAAGEKVLHDVSFVIEPGTKLALVGESGGGKTTISNLLMSLYHPDSGSIRIDGQDITTLTRASIRSAIATVFQDAALFSGTIRENIAYGRPDASHKEIERAAKAANAHDFVTKFRDGYDSEIGERGIKLSGGQKQRIAIARAILKDAPILILDEATSSLDSKAEHEVQLALDHLMEGRTTLIIAHRLSTIAGVDRIVTLRDGRVDEVGSPAELAQTEGIYAQLLQLQLGSTDKAKQQLAKYDIAV